MKIYGLIGYPLSHSFSQRYFTEKFLREKLNDCEFRNFPIESIDEFPLMLREKPELVGLSVTIPHKEKVMKFLKAADETVKKIRAVNCVRIRDMKGFNTDVFGFEHSLKPLLKPHHHHALILGTGGASKAVAYSLDKLKIKFRHVSRNSTKNSLGLPTMKIWGSNLPFSTKILSYSELRPEHIRDHTLIINTTPLGMFPNTNACPNIPYELLTSRHLLYDLIYNPEETLFLRKGKEKGAQIKNGLEMLHLQAEQAWRIWNETPQP